MQTNKDLASEFIKKYSNMFTEDQEFWKDEIEKLLNKSNLLYGDLLLKKLENKIKEIWYGNNK